MTFYDIEGCTHCVCTLYIMIIEMVCACVFVQSRTTSLFARLIYLFMYFDFRIFTLRKLLKLGKWVLSSFFCCCCRLPRNSNDTRFHLLKKNRIYVDCNLWRCANVHAIKWNIELMRTESKIKWKLLQILICNRCFMYRNFLASFLFILMCLLLCVCWGMYISKHVMHIKFTDSTKNFRRINFFFISRNGP